MRGIPGRAWRPGRIGHLVRLAFAAAMCLLPCACIVYRPVVTRPPTLGAELLELDAARRDGLLSQAEHDRLRTETIAAWKRVGDAPIEPIPAPK
jgi:hypothetical protein